MFEKVKYLKSNFTVAYEKIIDIEQSAADFFDYLKDKYSDPLTTQFAPNLPPEFPRIIFNSKNGFSKIVISQVALTLDVTYSPDWQNDISLGKGYIIERLPLIFDMVRGISKINLCFAGFINLTKLKSCVPEEQFLKSLNDIYFKDDLKGNDLMLRFTKIINNKFFSNIEIKNYRNWPTELITGYSIKRPTNKIVEAGVLLTHDLNNRYEFNEKESYKFDSEISKELIDKNSEIIDRELKRLLK